MLFKIGTRVLHSLDDMEGTVVGVDDLGIGFVDVQWENEYLGSALETETEVSIDYLDIME